MKLIDARGLFCPEPVILTKKALSEKPQGLIVMVDNLTSKINVERFLKIAGFQVHVEEKPNGEYHITTENNSLL